MITKSKTCSKCGETKELDCFVKNCHSSDGHYSRCKPCGKANYEKNKEKILVRQKKYYQNNRDSQIKSAASYRKRRAELQPDYRAVESRAAFARKLGISPDVIEEHYKRMFMKQQAACAICGTRTEELCIDHNHKKQGHDSLRGLLCKPCNVGISWFDDVPKLLGNARTYLIKN